MLPVTANQEKSQRCSRSTTESVSRSKSLKGKRTIVLSTSTYLCSLDQADSNCEFLHPVAPEVDLDASVKERMVVHAGGVIRIIAYVSGQPSPEVTWSRDGAALPPEAKIETTAISSSLVIKPCTRRHLGIYTLTAKNAGGEKTKNITVEVLGKILFIFVSNKTTS